jgi:hypothetical protein
MGVPLGVGVVPLGEVAGMVGVRDGVGRDACREVLQTARWLRAERLVVQC